MHPIHPGVIALVKEFEGKRLIAYLCPAGVPTIGYGHTATVTAADVMHKKTITEAEAERLLTSDLATAAASVNRLVRVALTDMQRGALASLVFNIGAGNFASSTLLKLLNSGDYSGAARQLEVWVKATVTDRQTGARVKVTMPGLVRRRAAERALFETRL